MIRISLQAFALVLTLGIASVDSALFAQESGQELGKPLIRSFDVADYPSSSAQNWEPVQGPRGRIFVGSSSGIQIYDGVAWSHLNSPNVGVVFDLLPVGDRIYFGTAADLGYFEAGERGDWRVVSLLEGSGAPEIDVIYQVEQTPFGIFFSSERNILWWRPEHGLRWITATSIFGRISVVGDQLYVSEPERGLVRFDPESERLETIPGGEVFIGQWVAQCLESEGRFLAVEEKRALFEYRDGRFVPFPTEVDAWLRNEHSFILLSLPDGGIAIGSATDGLVLLNGDGSLRRHISVEHGLPWRHVSGLMVDHQGGLWVSQIGGISRIDIASGATYFDRTLDALMVEQILRYQGHLFMATQAGLRILRPGEDRQARFKAPRFKDLARSSTWSLLDAGDRLLVGDTAGIVAVSFDAAGEMKKNERLFQGRRALDFVRSRNESDIVYAGLQDGALRLRKVGGRWRSDGKLRGVDRTVVFVEQAADGALWLGTTTGLYYRVRQLDRWPDASIETFDAASGLASGNCHLFRVGDRVVFATEEGFRRLAEGPEPRFEPDPAFGPSLTDGNLDIHRLAEGGDGRLWLFAGGVAGVVGPDVDGVLIFDPDPLRILPPGKIDAILAEPDGVIWFGKYDGLIRFDSRRTQTPPAPLALQVQRVVDLASSERIFDGATVAASLSLPPRPPEARSLRFEVAQPDYALPAAVRYRYQLEGLDKGWGEWSPDSRKDYANLPFGPLKLRIEAKDAYGRIAPAAAVSFRVSPPWFRTPVAYLLAALLGVAAIAGLVVLVARRHTVRLEAERQHLTAEVAKRTGELEARTAELQARTQDLQAANEARAQLFANVSHEFRTPLTLTLGPLEDAGRGRYGDLSPELGGDLQVALRNSRQLLNLVDQVLDINRLEAGALRVQASAANFGAFLAEVADNFRVAAAQAQIALDLTAIESGVEVWFDAALLERVVVNLVANAFKFTPAGGTITLSMKRRQDRVVFVVEDDGPGISEEDLPRVFERFFQASTPPARGESGTGIGLSLVKQLVDLHAGSVLAASAPGQGTQIRVLLPLGHEHLAPDQRVETSTHREKIREAQATALIGPQASSSRPGPELVDDQPSLLVVDDNAELRGFLSRIFAASYRVLEAGDGVVALEQCRRRLPDLIVCDVMMPRMTGFEFLRALRADPELDFLPVILLTARATAEDSVAGLDTGADDYLRKPFDSNELEARVRALIASRRRLKARWRSTPDQDEGPKGKPKTKFEIDLMATLERRLGDPTLNVETLATDLAMDRSNLYRHVRATLGVGPNRLIRQLRLESAAHMLASGEGTVSEVAYSFGFKSIAYFSDSFRKQFGKSPSAWRRQHSRC